MSDNVPDLQEQLVALLSAELDSATVYVRFGWPLKEQVSKLLQRVYVLMPKNYLLGGGEQFRNESFALRFAVEVAKSGDHPAETSRQMWELIGQIDTVLTEADFGGYANQGLSLSVDPDLTAYDSGYFARADCAIGAKEEV